MDKIIELVQSSLSGNAIVFFIMLFITIFLARLIVFGRSDRSRGELDIFLSETRDTFFELASIYEPILVAEKEYGRKAAKLVIENILIERINASTTLKEHEKSIILRFNLGFIVDQMELELVKRGLLNNE